MIKMTPLTALTSANSCFRASNVNSEPLCCAWGIKILQLGSFLHH